MEGSEIIIDLIFLISAGFLSFVFYPLWINFVYKFQMGEDVRTDGPLTHLKKAGTPTMGGLVFVGVIALLTLIFNTSRTQTLLPIFVASLSGLLGIFEDFTKVYRRSGLPGFLEYHFGALFKRPSLITISDKKMPFWKKPLAYFKEFFRILGSSESSGVQSHHKIVMQGMLALFVAYWTYFKLGWDYLWLPLIGYVHIGFLYPIIIFVLFLVVLNLVAFTDGLDGLAGGLAVITAVGLWVVASYLGYNSLSTFTATFIGALLPFLYFNIFPARVLMGNVGSHFLGAFLLMLAIVMHREIAFIVMAMVFLLDGLSSPLQQLSVKLTKKRLFRMAPVHHHFELLGWPETKVTLRFWLAGTFFTLLGLFIALL
ncbi:hypothetical protein A3K34_02740 [candidate division WWE3 bacterium RIFOXYC1_FULL_40_10]|uniref:Phospho-N-acetylmuramoyl-pentapeptide-transferase n=1 Tax=candidate division WWE3 bacterium RIFOXYA2_FULL_46_9 TaxID=1802636 RepID=A0A1F4W2U7_UNCKA|nr:MAG: hypothetical protein A3K58_02740 [candidate division WWE3 bacterium RIFOXYB1_FULL_40_22]OGC61763.1 MAG: hypothetical protein A3K37_02740 [candidate division WWE3 bacterium RIFOXYA1_FULL_40_11]OGC63746.1 MAG: hypothetical protein A2264_05230 [candidate division WWE3 bacterium RIFOXYA2_FULL_46_9]OGC65187.1 MAG: hypothetical protein A2326_02410 [candidate division WWE3 bacterium RIFOXYB2_FULL_41_6]OGC66146.1 MAG: hypothetical protein A3K34_02740 [candidate division WWE3 bacterium RIFOXYC1_